MLFALLTACALDELGVLSLSITLEPAHLEGMEMPFEPEEMALLGDASGLLDVDVGRDVAIFEASGLPDAPEGWRYIPELSLAEHPREGLHGGGGEGEGHAHGALEAEDDGVPDGGDHEEEEEEEEAHDDGHGVRLAPLIALPVDGDYQRIFTRADLGSPLGAIRGASVLVVPDEREDGMEMEVLSGSLDLEEDEAGGSTEEEPGHTHGA